MQDVFISGAMINNSMKKYVAIALATLVVIVSLPILTVFSMGSSVISFLAGTPSAEAAASQGFYMGGPVPGDTYEWGNCTYWAFAQRLWAGHPIPTSWGNANTWDDNATFDGYEVNHTPTVGAVMQTDVGKWGHVAYVTKVETDTGKWEISEMNSQGLNVVSTRTFTASSALYYTFIHDKKVTP
jgi:surface antigen